MPKAARAHLLEAVGEVSRLGLALKVHEAHSWHVRRLAAQYSCRAGLGVWVVWGRQVEVQPAMLASTQALPNLLKIATAPYAVNPRLALLPQLLPATAAHL